MTSGSAEHFEGFDDLKKSGQKRKSEFVGLKSINVTVPKDEEASNRIIVSVSTLINGKTITTNKVDCDIEALLIKELNSQGTGVTYNNEYHDHE